MLVEFLQCHSGTMAAITIIGATGLIEVSPIKINPIECLLNAIGKKMNKGIQIQIEEVGNELGDLKAEFSDHRIGEWRQSILNFSNSCRYDRKHTKEEFDHIIGVHDAYSEYIEKNKLKNGKVDEAYQQITDIYGKCLKNNTFL